MSNKKCRGMVNYRLIDQLLAIRRKYPNSEVNIRRGTLHWRGDLKPSPLSRTYCVTVSFKIGQRPIVMLVGEKIPGVERPDFPHKFYTSKDGKRVQLCLHLRYEFCSGMLISDTIIPWAIEWLYFYELWLATGTWHGGGRHPEISKKKI